jgi:Arc-like DNA binding domain
MAKRKKTDTVQLKVRLREALRRRLESGAKANEISLNSEIVTRLEQSILQAQNSFLLEALLAPGLGLDFLRAIATVIRQAGPQWSAPPASQAVSDAVCKLLAVFTGELLAVEDSFPNHKDRASSDHLAWLALLVTRFHLASEIQLKGTKQ